MNLLECGQFLKNFTVSVEHQREKGILAKDCLESYRVCLDGLLSLTSLECCISRQVMGNENIAESPRQRTDLSEESDSNCDVVARHAGFSFC